MVLSVRLKSEGKNNPSLAEIADAAQMSWQDTISGVCGSVCCTGLGLPFDVAKARLQNAPGVYGGMLDCMAKAVRLEGPGRVGRRCAISSGLRRVILEAKSFGRHLD